MAYPPPPMYGEQPYGHVPGVPQPYPPPPAMHSNIVAVQPQTIVVQQHLAPMKRDWSTPLCGCCQDCGVCCASFFCWWCYTCHVAVTMDEHCCVGFFTPGAQIAMRARIREKEKIHGGICHDTALYFFCHCCALAQLGIDIKRIKQRGGQL